MVPPLQPLGAEAMSGVCDRLVTLRQSARKLGLGSVPMSACLSGLIFGKLNLPPPNHTQPIRSVGDGTGRARQIWFALVPLSGLESKSP